MAVGEAAQPQAVRSRRVVLDAYAFIKGWLIATSLWVGLLLLLVEAYVGLPAARDGADAGHVWGFLGMAVLYGFGVALVFAGRWPGCWPTFCARSGINGSTSEAFSQYPPSRSGCWEVFWVLAGSPCC
jgi:hypothetical protein